MILFLSMANKDVGKVFLQNICTALLDKMCRFVYANYANKQETKVLELTVKRKFEFIFKDISKSI